MCTCNALWPTPMSVTYVSQRCFLTTYRCSNNCGLYSTRKHLISETTNHHPRTKAQAETEGPSPDDQRSVLVKRFGSSPATYFDDNFGVRLRVDPGCLCEEQVAGPIAVVTDRSFIVESEGSSFLVTTVVDCQPSGATFKNPLSLGICIGEGNEGFDSSDAEDVKEDKDSDESRPDEEGREEYLSSLNSTHKVRWEYLPQVEWEYLPQVLCEVTCWALGLCRILNPTSSNVCIKTPQFFWRAEEGEAWTVQEGATTFYDEGLQKYLFQANISHFCQGCVGQKLYDSNSSQVERVWHGAPFKRELEFVNATKKAIKLRVRPTRYEDSAISSLAAGVEAAGVAVNVSLKRENYKEILDAATDYQEFTVPPKTGDAQLQAGDLCPFETCTLVKKGGHQARVELITVDGHVESVWLDKIFGHRTRLVVLPRMFDGSVKAIRTRNLGADPPSAGSAGGAAIPAPAATVGGASADEKEGGASAHEKE